MSGTAAALASDFEHPADSDTSQQFTPPVPPPAPPANAQRRDRPNDPKYDQTEPDGNTPHSTNLFDERFDLFGFPSSQTATTAKYADSVHGHTPGEPQVSGFNAAGAWKAERGRGDVSVAILDTGIKWDKCGLRDKIRLNTGELPPPEDSSSNTHPNAPLGGYDLNGNGVVDVDDYKDDPRVGREFTSSCGGQITAKDLINAFSDHTDTDGNGFVDDIAGWNFFDDNNDPTDRSSYFAAANHGSGRTGEAVEQGNDADGSIGVCPHCQFVPIRVWDTFVADGNNFGMGMIYAADNGVNVIEGADGSLYHSAFAEAASQYAYEKGVTQTYSGDDLNTGNHNYPANYNHTMLIQGVVTDVEGLGKDQSGNAQQLAGLCANQPPAVPQGCPGTNAPVKTYFRGANTTQFGGHSSVAMEGATGSTNTGKASGAAALVISAGKDAHVDLNPDETREILEQTAEDVTAPNTVGTGNPDPAPATCAQHIDCWSEHFGWGRVDLGQAVSVAQSGKIPPSVSIDSPDWFAPLTGDSVPLKGHIRAHDGGTFTYRVEWGAGLAPTSWNPVPQGSGTTSGTVTDLGTLDLNAIRTALLTHVVPQDTGGPVFSPASRNPYQDQFAVRVVVTQAGVPTPGVDRKVFTALPDGQGLRPGFPKRLGTGGEAPIRYYDLDGDGTPELVVPTEDGKIHAYEPNGSELPGWPVQTQVQYSAAGHGNTPAFKTGGVAMPHEPPRGPTIADLDGDGVPEIITAAGLRIYVFEPDGSLRPGFPVRNDPSFCRPQDEAQHDGSTGYAYRHKCGFLATPAVGHLEGAGKPLDIVAASLDGHLYALRGDGTPLPGFPVELVDPGRPDALHQDHAELINDPAIGDLNGDGKDDVVEASNEVYGGSGSGGDVSFGGLLGAAGNAHTDVYAIDGSNGHILPGWPIRPNGLILDTLPLIGPGHDAALVSLSGQERIVASVTSGSLATYKPNGSLDKSMQQGDGINLFESSSVGDLLGTGGRDVVKYQVDAAQAANLLLVGQNTPYSHRIGAFDASTGASLPNYPTITDDYQFLSASNVAKVSSIGPTNQVVAGNGLGMLHAYDGATGADVLGFPKVTGGWLFAPAALSDDGRMADITREGFLFEWGVPGLPPCQSEWPSFRHDPHGSGNYDHDGTPPAAPRNLHITAGTLTFTAPGDDFMCGRVTKYQVVHSDSPITPQNFSHAEQLVADQPGAVDAGSPQTIPIPSQTRRFVAVRAIDDQGNVGRPGVFDRSPGGGGHPDVGTGGPGFGAGFGSCQDLSRPTASFDSRHSFAHRHRLALSGRGRDRGCGAGGAGSVRSFRIAIAQVVPGGCRFVDARGRLGRRRSCRRPVYIAGRAGRGTSSRGWSFRRAWTLPRGRYVVLVRSVDAAGNSSRPATLRFSL